MIETLVKIFNITWFVLSLIMFVMLVISTIVNLWQAIDEWLIEKALAIRRLE